MAKSTIRQYYISLVSFFVLLMSTYSTGEIDTNRLIRETTEIHEAIKRIEDHLRKEDRLREIRDIVRIDSTMDKLGKQLDQVISTLEQRHVTPVTGRGDTSVMPRDFSNSLDRIDLRLQKLETIANKLEHGLSKAEGGFEKMEEIEKMTSRMKSDFDLKLRKMMNVITELYNMNKKIETNVGGRTETTESNAESSSNYAAEFFIENLEELERKIKEQFSVLSNEIRSEITGLKIVASSVSDGCRPGGKDSDYDDDTPKSDVAKFRGSRRSVERRNERQSKTPASTRSANKVEETLDDLVQRLGRSTQEIREEIHQGIQTIDNKLSNLTEIAKSPHACDNLEPAESISKPVIVPSQNIKEKKKSDRKDSCTRIARSISSPTSCAELRKGGVTCDGIYVIFPKSVRAVRVVCDMTTDGGGWTVLMRRGDFDDKMTSFHRNWLSYKNGFGDMEGEFWLGNEVMSLLTAQDDNILKVHLQAFDEDSTNLTYSSFSVGNESSNYRLHIGPTLGPSSPASNSLRYHNNHPFSTFDRKNDNFEQNCAATYKGGWWFNGCYFGFLTGEYFRPDDKRENWQGILWYDWKGNASLKGAQMLIRPKNFASS